MEKSCSNLKGNNYILGTNNDHHCIPILHQVNWQNFLGKINLEFLIYRLNLGLSLIYCLACKCVIYCSFIKENKGVAFN